MGTKISTDVLIIGGGPSGILSAIYLDKLGISNIVVERQFEVSEHPKAHELSARSIEILTQLGICIEELREEASPYRDASRVLFCHTINEEIGQIDLQKGGNDEKYKTHLASPEPYLNLSQTVLEKILRKKLNACNDSQLLVGHQWESMAETPSGIDCTILNRKDKSSFSIQSKYVICADGAGSRSRKSLDIPMIGDEKLADFISVYFEHNLRGFVKTSAKLYWIMHPEAPGTFIAHHIEKRWVYHFPIFMPYEKQEHYPEAILRQRILTALGDEDIPLDIKSISFWRMTCQIASTFRKGKAFLVGDAAHRFPPTGGLGMNSGIGDVQNLCWKMAMVLKDVASEKLLDSYDVERRPVIALNKQESLHNYEKIWEVPEAMGLKADAMLWKARLLNSFLFRFIPKSWINLILKRLYQVLSKKIISIPQNPKQHKKVNQAIQDQIEHFDRIGLDLGYYYDQGAIAYNDNKQVPPQKVSQYQPSIEPGTRFPHFWVYNGKKQSSHNWLHPNKFTLLCNEEGADWWASNAHYLSKKILALIQVQNVTQQLSSQPDDSDERTYYDINSVPLLLVRPDGQIAWKPENLDQNLNHIFHKLLP